MFANGFLTFSKVAGRIVTSLLPDIMFLGGAASIIFGVHLWSVPMAFVVGGGIAMLFGIMAVRKK